MKYPLKRPFAYNNKKVSDIIVLKDLICEKQFNSYVVLMAGGVGSRLSPLTNEIPKPMLKLGDKPILEIILNQFRELGFINFIISINYLGDIVQGYFGDGRNFGVNIQYVKETKKLGTIGCLRLLKSKLNTHFFVMNCDVLTKIDYNTMLSFHLDNDNYMTLGIRRHQYTIPYGILKTQGDIITDLVEKPVESCMINAGVYCLNPEVIDMIPDDISFDITDLIELCIRNGKKVGGYEIKEYWIDIGQIEDYYKANMDYEEYFVDNVVLDGRKENMKR